MPKIRRALKLKIVVQQGNGGCNKKCYVYHIKVFYIYIAAQGENLQRLDI